MWEEGEGGGGLLRLIVVGEGNLKGFIGTALTLSSAVGFSTQTHKNAGSRCDPILAQAGRRFRDMSKHGYNSFFREVCSDGVVLQPPNCFIKQIRTRPLVVYHLNVNAHCVGMQLRYERSQSRLFPLPSRMINTSWYVNFISSFVKELTASGTGASMLSGWCLLLLLVLLKRLGLV